MTKKEREGLEQLTTVGENYALATLPSVRAALDWIYRQMTMDDRRRRKRGSYKKAKF